VEAAARIVQSAVFARRPFASWSGHERLTVTAQSSRAATVAGRVSPAQRLRLLTSLVTLATDLHP
jgi:hypothetical protein